MIVKAPELLKGDEGNVMVKAASQCYKLTMFSWYSTLKCIFYLAGHIQFDFCLVSVQSIHSVKSNSICMEDCNGFGACHLPVRLGFEKYHLPET